MKRKLLIVGLILTSIILTCCNRQTELFRHVELHGRVVDSTGAPLVMNINLWGGGPPYETYSASLGQTTSSSDGTFHLKTHGVHNKEYTLIFTVPGGKDGVAYPKLVEGKNIDVGTIKMNW